MTDSADAQARVAHAVTGMVAGGYAIDFDLAAGLAPCRRCGESLARGDDVTAAVANYEGHTWELYGLYCSDHGADSIDATMGERSDEQAVLAATLEPTGYHDPLGDHHPDAVSIGGIEILDYSPVSYD